MLSRKVADKLRAYQTPFYLYDIALLRQTLESVVYESKRYGYIVHYAIKANYDDKILSVINEYGLGIDCASGNELRKAVEMGFDPGNIVYAGVGKKDSEIEYAIDQKILTINCESIEEIHVINEIALRKGAVVDIALRINPDIDPRTNACIDTGQADSKFGISYEEVMENADSIKALTGVNIIGIHLHIGSQIRELHVFENMCNKVNVIVEKLTSLGFNFEFVDVGGGLGVNYDMPENEPIPNFASLFAIINNHLKVGERPVHFEFGRSIVAECGELITKVMFNKTTATGRQLVICDASMTELVRPAMYGAYHNIENITSQEAIPSRKYTVVGTACESTDVFVENASLRTTKRGDLLTMKSAGAYGMSMASRYNLHDLPGAVYSDEL
ncbi:MAG: diaminopimelate decarboxylase [Rikenellaceae bacterium]